MAKSISKKTLCEIKKRLNKSFEEFCALVDQPEFACTKCGRVANEARNLCKARPLG